MNSLTPRQLAQIERQRVGHSHDRPISVDIPLTGSDTLEGLVVHPDVMNPALMTSRYLARWLARNPEYYRGKDVLDMGSGTGVQGIVMARYGAKSVTFVDNEFPRARNTLENVRRFGIKERVLQGDLLEALDGEFGCVLFNHPFFAANYLWRDERKAATAMTTDPGLIHRFLEQAKRAAFVIMPFYHVAPEWNDPGVVAPQHGYRIVRHDRMTVTTGLQRGEVSFYLLDHR